MGDMNICMGDMNLADMGDVDDMGETGEKITLEQMKEKFAWYDQSYREKVDAGGSAAITEVRLILDRMRDCSTPYQAFRQDVKARRGIDCEKVIFLDIDGVLNTDTRHDPEGCVDEDKVQCLKQIVDATGAQIVLSSSWRRGFKEYFDYLECRDKHDPAVYEGAREALLKDMSEYESGCKKRLLDLFDKYGLRIGGRIKSSDLSGPDARPYEIRLWLRDKPFVKSFVILDDDDFWTWGWLTRHFVRTRTPFMNKGDSSDCWDLGLTEIHAREAIRILNDYPAAKDLYPGILKQCIDDFRDRDYMLDHICDCLCVDAETVKREAAKIGYNLHGVPGPALPGEMSDRDLGWLAAYMMESDDTLRKCRLRYDDGREVYRELHDILTGGYGISRVPVLRLYGESSRDDARAIRAERRNTPDNAIIICVDGVLNDGSSEHAGQIDEARLKDVAKLSKCSGAGVVLYAQGLDSVKAYFRDADSIRLKEYDDDRCREKTAALREAADGECRHVLDMFDAAKVPLYGCLKYYQDDEYGLPYAVREWLAGHPLEYGFVVLCKEPKAWGWMYEHEAGGKYTRKALKAAAEILATRPYMLSGRIKNRLYRLLDK